MTKKFKVVSSFNPTGDQPQAIESLAEGLKDGLSAQVLLGATGTGKTFTVAKVIEQVQLPTLVIAHNKTLAAQLAAEFKNFFPENYVGYFVSYYDYYQPEAYIAATDTYIEKDASINDEIDQMRHSATCSLFERRDVIIVASVSCIYGLGSPENYSKMLLHIKVGQIIPRDKILRRLIEIRYERNDMIIERGNFRVRGDVIEVTPAGYNGRALRIELFGDEVDKITEFEILTGKVIGRRDEIFIFPASHYVTDLDDLQRAEKSIRAEMTEQVEKFTAAGKLIEAQRIEQRTRFDLEMIQEMGYCSGIENYSRHLTGRKEGEPPFTLIDYFQEKFLTVVDESHVTLPQLHSMYHGDRSRKLSLVEYGFRLPSALDNRPLNFEEFEKISHPTIYLSATPGPYELEHSAEIVELLIRPTGLVDPKVSVRPTANQVDDLMREISKRVALHERVLALTLTKKMAEHLSEYVTDLGIKAKYLHSEIHTLERIEILRDFRLGKFDLLIGINLLREGLDLPEISLVAILDADKEGFLRSTSALMQISGRAARNLNGEVIMYADKVTSAMQVALDEMKRRREQQLRYNSEHKIVPHSVKKQIIEELVSDEQISEIKDKRAKSHTKAELRALETEMYRLAANLEFEKAAKLRDELRLCRLDADN